ncbi:hypothetical protein NQ315_002450 [Exocentrus adspersus]|uniref:Cytochrome P450 n=1 Tax=Exocentrus adspersus TaxID=1586481 RepID=A0AAV8V5R8_9CUCU|nr:hypothetical protein NQ315_002450 [Exocentrus adspersus]
MFRCEGKYPLRRSHLALQKYRLDRPNIYNSGGLLPTNGPEWFRIRTVFQKGLSSPSSVKNYLKDADTITREWLTGIEKLNSKPSVDYLDELSRLFLELIGQVALDVRLNSFSKEEHRKPSRTSKLIQAALDTNSCILKTDNGLQLWKKVETPLFKKLRKSQEYMEEVAIDLLSLKMTTFNEKEKNAPQTLLETYLSSPELDFKDIIGIVCDFLLAGIDTQKNSDVQDRLYEESCKLLSSKNSPVTSDILQEAVYAKAVLKESLRLRPISIGIGRVLQKEAVFSGYSVPPDAVRNFGIGWNGGSLDSKSLLINKPDGPIYLTFTKR